jgi:hypothetical protein
MFRRHSRHPQRTLHQDLQQITQVLQLCYIVLTANVEHVGFANCDENNICVYFTYNIETVKDRVCYVTLSMVEKLYVGTAVLHSAWAHYSMMHNVSVFRHPCMLNVGQCITVCCSGNKTYVSTGRHRDTVVTRVQL